MNKSISTLSSPEFINIHYIDNEEMGITIDIIG